MYNRCRLSVDVEFFINVFPGIEWVPYNIFGATKFTDESIYCLGQSADLNTVLDVLDTPFELIQFLQVNDYRAKIDIERKSIGERTCEYHKHGKQALINKYGSCATYSGLFFYFCHQKGYNTHNIVMLTNSGNGHAMNFIIKDKNYYFCDIYSQLNDFSDYIAKETGNKKDFARARYITGACLKTNKLENFIKLITKYNMLNKKSFVFLTNQSATLPNISISENNSIMKLWLNQNDKWNIACGLPDDIVIYDQNNNLFTSLYETHHVLP